MKTVFSRRDFLRLTAPALLGPALDRHSNRLLTPPRPIFWGRVIFVYATIYSRPSIYAATGIIHELDSVLPIYAEVPSDDPPPNNKRWYETDNGYVYSTNVQPVNNVANTPQVVLTPQLSEISVPFVDALLKPTSQASVKYRLYFSSVHWVTQSVVGADGAVWYELLDDRSDIRYYVPASAVRLISAAEVTPISPQVTDKRIEINTTAETITALEYDRPVFTTRISSGGSFGEGKDFRTPLGNYHVDRKRPSRHMAAGDGAADDAYDLPGVPWVSYFNGGIAIHGTYWHNDFGHPWSHGCINLLSQDAKWFYRWTSPAVAFGQDLVQSPGTSITVF
jgi:lipoprotein-anchoring transpeptidase ErfK/SrfK